MNPVDVKGPIGVLCGGPSAEREISLSSGKAVAQALKQAGFDVRLVVLSEIPDGAAEVIQASGIRTAFIALHGPFGEDGTIQSLLEDLGIPYTGSSVEASRYALDKVFSRRRWAVAHLPVPKWRLAAAINAEIRSEMLHFPLLVKPIGQGSSLGMSLVENKSELVQAVRQASVFGEELILEEFLPGIELTVGILNEEALPVIQIVPKRRFYDTIAKYQPGQCDYVIPAPLDENQTRFVQSLALSAHEALGCQDFSRVDMIWVPDFGPVLLEINTIPGMTPTSLLPKAAKEKGIDFNQLCARMLESAVRRSESMGSLPAMQRR